MSAAAKKDDAFANRKPRLEYIPLKNLCVVWVQAQRPFDPRHAQTLADEFDPEKFGTLSVTLPNGRGVYHLIDGQHRKGAIEMMGWGGEQKLPCNVFEATDPARAAELFDAINSSRKNPSPLDRFKVRVVAGYIEYVAVDKIVRDRGYVIESHKNQKGISCVQALLSVYQSHGGETLDKALQIIQATWGMDKNSTDANIIRGYGAVMVEHHAHANWQRLKDVIAKKYTPGRLLGAAKTAREVHGGSMANAVKQLIIATYNRGAPAAKHLTSKSRSKET